MLSDVQKLKLTCEKNEQAPSRIPTAAAPSTARVIQPRSDCHVLRPIWQYGVFWRRRLLSRGHRSQVRAHQPALGHILLRGPGMRTQCMELLTNWKLPHEHHGFSWWVIKVAPIGVSLGEFTISSATCLMGPHSSHPYSHAQFWSDSDSAPQITRPGTCETSNHKYHVSTNPKDGCQLTNLKNT